MHLRDYQHKLIDELRESIRRGSRSPLMQASTGLGKTIISSAMIRSAVDKGKRVLFIAPRRQLVWQTSEKLTCFGVPHGIIMAGEQPSMSPQVQVASVQTLYSRCFVDGEPVRSSIYGRGMPLPQADLVVIDEAHAVFGQMAQKIIAEYTGAIKIGMTATPCRADGRGLGEIYDDIVCGPSTRWAMDNGYLTELRYFGPSEWDMTGVKIQGGDYHKGQLSERVNKAPLIGDVVENWTRIAPDKNTVVFAVDRKHAKALQTEFIRWGVAAEYIDGNTPQDERQQIFQRMESGASMVLCSVAVVDMGWDAPWAECGVLARPTKSLARYLQAVGRILRPAPGKEDACLARGTIIDTDKGPVPIEHVTIDHRVWDGYNYVRHSGAVCKGVQAVITYSGITATPDHEVLTNDGWQRLENAARNGRRIIESRTCREELRKLDNRIENGRRVSASASCRSVLRALWLYANDAFPQYKKTKKNNCVRQMQHKQTASRPFVDIPPMSGSAGSVCKSQSRMLSPLRWLWDRVSILRCKRGSALDSGQSRHPQRQKDAVGSNRQRRSLRARKSSLGKSSCQYEQYRKGWWARFVYRVSASLPRCKIRGQNLGETSDNLYVCRDKQPMEQAILQAEREVWDIHNAGPLQRYSANGKIVHNCLIDHTGAVRELGFVDDDFHWTLEGVEKRESKDPERKAKEKTVVECPKCNAEFRPGPECPNCGADMTAHSQRAIDAVKAELQEIDRAESQKAAKEMTLEQKGKFLSELMGYARKKGYKDGWAVHAYKEKTGVLPWPVWPQAPREPGPETMGWITHLNIKRAKRREAA